MKRYSIRLLITLLTFALGAGLTNLGRVMTSRIATLNSRVFQEACKSGSSLPVIRNDTFPDDYVCCPVRESTIVVSVPNDYEIYIGKDKVTLKEIPTKVSFMMRNASPDAVILIKTADFVKYRTFAPIIERIREASANRIGLLRNKKRQVKLPTVK